jgi:transcriptional regulator with XRE-family HTH domain
MAGNHLTARAFLAREIRLAREAKGMSRAALGKSVFVSESLVTAWEKGRYLPKPDVMDRLEGTLGTRGVLARMLDDLVSVTVPLEWFGRWVEIEGQATALWSFELAVVPGLLQTEDYARAVLRAANHLADTDEMVSARLERQRILTKEDSPILVVLMDQSVPQRNIGGAKVMHDQLLHLAEMAELDNVVVQIVPLTAVVCAGFLSGFVIANFDGGSDVAYVDNQLSGEVVEHAEDVVRLRRMFEVFRADALPQRESVQLIIRMAEQWKA